MTQAAQEDLQGALSELLSSPEELQKLMSLAQSLSGGFSGERNAPDETVSQSSQDAETARTVMRLLRSLQADEGEKEALIRAMKPFLRSERAEALDRAVRVTRFARAARLVMSGGDRDV